MNAFSDKSNSNYKRKSSHPKSDSHENINEIPGSKLSSPSGSSSTSIATDTSNSQSQVCNCLYFCMFVNKSGKRNYYKTAL